MKRAFLGVLLASILWLEACTVPAWVNVVEGDAKVAAPIAASLIEVIDPSVAPLVSLIENGFNALVSTLDTFKSSPTATNLQAVQSAFAAVNANVAQLESAAQIKNAATATTVTQVVGLLAQAVTEIAALVPPQSKIPNSGVMGTANSGVVKHWKAGDFKKAFNQVAKQDPRLKPLK